MNGIYLSLLLREIKEQLAGAYIQEILIRDRIVQLVLNDSALFVSLYPTALGMYIARMSKQGYELFKQMSDSTKSCRIVEVIQSDYMPVLKLMLEKSFPTREELQIIISLYPQAPNFSLMVQNRQKNLYARYIERKPKNSILDLKSEELASASVDYLVKHIEGIDKKLASALDEKNFASLKAWLDGEAIHPRLLTVDPLRISLFAGEGGKTYGSFNDLFDDAIEGFLRSQEEQKSEQQRRSAIRSMKRRLARLQKKIRTPEEIQDLRARGELILANIRKIKKGSEKIRLVDPYTQVEKEIELDPHLSPQANAQRYFTKYKKEKRGQPQLREQVKVISGKIKDLESKVVIPETRVRKLQAERASKEPFHRFLLESGSVVLVGKNARTNDELTFKHARPSDYFFHTRGFEGAHTILKPNIPRGQRPSRQEIMTAASIAAYFSKARKQNNVPVSYTQRKFLKKNKKAKPGSVILMREEVVFVEPELPKRNSH
ncbi:MAG: NFACT RNA binding domain-containing protein [candidate division WOR-3 bacterium]|jgi:predicted ribosome quality control (RQC) complex YloA/Tae2 family protein